MANIEEIRKCVKELFEMKKIYEARHEENKLNLAKLQAKAEDSHAKLLQAKQNHQRMTELVSAAHVKIEEIEKERNGYAEFNKTMLEDIKDLDKQIQDVNSGKHVFINEMNTSVYKTANETRELLKFYDRNVCLRDTPILEKENEALKEECEELNKNCEDLAKKAKRMGAVLEEERRKERLLPSLTMKKFLLKEARYERRALAVEMMQAKAKEKEMTRQKEMSKYKTPDSPDSVCSQPGQSQSS